MHDRLAYEILAWGSVAAPVALQAASYVLPGVPPEAAFYAAAIGGSVLSFAMRWGGRRARGEHVGIEITIAEVCAGFMSGVFLGPLVTDMLGGLWVDARNDTPTVFMTALGGAKLTTLMVEGDFQKSVLDAIKKRLDGGQK